HQLQSGDRIQGIEEKMRVKLHSQGLQLRLRQLCFELGSFQLFFAILSVIAQRHTNCQNQAIDDKPRQVVGYQHKVSICNEGPQRAEPINEAEVDSRLQNEMGERDKDASQQIDQQSSSQPLATKCESTPYPQDDRSDRQPEDPGDQRGQYD